jgi:hypothetical protein
MSSPPAARTSVFPGGSTYRQAAPDLPAQVVFTGLPAVLILLHDPAALTTAAFSTPGLAAAVDGLVADLNALNCDLVAEHSTGHWVALSFALDTVGDETLPADPLPGRWAPTSANAADPIGSPWTRESR